MASRKRSNDLRAASKLVVHATKGVTDVVREMHVAIASGPDVLGKPLAKPVRLLAAGIYGPIRGITHLVGEAIDAVLAQLSPLLGESESGPTQDAAIAALNGVVGDYLAAADNPLAIAMELRLREAFPKTPKLLVLVHGSAMTDHQWTRRGHDHGEKLAAAFGYTPVYLRYNSGLHISTNGKGFADELERLVSDWPCAVDEISILGHSMGGLVARSACHAARTKRLGWRRKLQRLATLGSPHHGAPLERGGSWVHALLGATTYSAPLARLARIRSAGVTDLRYGNVLDQDWLGKERFDVGHDTRRNLALPQGVACYAVAGTLAKHDMKRLPGDGLVPVASALGRHTTAERTLAFPQDHQLVAFGTGHLDLLSRPEVYAKLHEWFG
jgi:pimeloyl-ACP methyl ester carboxylesterase